MDNKTAVNNSAYYYSINMLRLLLAMKLITQEEFDRIARISANHYGVKIHCV